MGASVGCQVQIACGFGCLVALPCMGVHDISRVSSLLSYCSLYIYGLLVWVIVL